MGKVPKLFIGTWQRLVEVIGVELEEEMYAGMNETAMWNTMEVVIRVYIVEVYMVEVYIVEVYKVENYKVLR